MRQTDSNDDQGRVYKNGKFHDLQGHGFLFQGLAIADKLRV